MYKRRVVVGASLLLLAGCSGSTVTTVPTTTPPPLAHGTVTTCQRDNEGFVRVGGTVQNLTNTLMRVEVTIGVYDTSTNKQVDFTQAKSSPLQAGQSESYTAAVYSIDGKSSVPMNIRIQCRVTDVQAMDPNEVG
jgi:hypothetical protein